MSEFDWWYFLNRHWGKILGGLLGLIFALLVVKYGFWLSVFIYLCIAIGLVIGWRLDVGKGPGRYLKKLFSANKEEI